MASWGYSESDGPATWSKDFPLAGGSNQSPINIDTKAAAYDANLKNKDLKLKYEPEVEMVVQNTGKSVKINTRSNSVITGGPMSEQTYKLEQFHLHWGSEDNKGSEHTIDDKIFAAELHLVHWNSSKYSSFSEAVDKEDGLAVLGILIKVGNEHSSFKKITDAVTNILLKNQEHTVSGKYDVSSLLPSDTTKYYTYHGSLTTPPCCESVTWMVFDEVMELSSEQIQALRSMCWEEDPACHIVDNFRSPLPLGSRKLRKSFQ